MKRAAIEFETIAKLILVILVVLAMYFLVVPRISTLGKAILKLFGG